MFFQHKTLSQNSNFDLQLQSNFPGLPGISIWSSFAMVPGTETRFTRSSIQICQFSFEKYTRAFTSLARFELLGKRLENGTWLNSRCQWMTHSKLEVEYRTPRP
jgi:hypothetical protein